MSSARLPGPPEPAAPDDPLGPAATIVPYPDGPLIVRGDFQLQQPDGTPIGYDGAAVALCRCGRSATKPLCDGSHKLARRSTARSGSPSDLA